jgi:Flp pilus assembly protein TadG
MPITRPLSETAVTKLNGSGNGTAKVGPLSAREIWYPGNVHINVATNNAEASCKIFVGPDTTQSNFRDTADFGSTGDNTGACNADRIKVGWYVWAVWTGGDPNAQAVLTVTGTKSV